MADTGAWRPEAHKLCRIKPDDTGGQINPDGVWQVLSHGPDSATSWWLMPIDGDARRWASTHRSEVVSQCIQVKGNRLGPRRVFAENREGPR